MHSGVSFCEFRSERGSIAATRQSEWFVMESECLIARSKRLRGRIEGFRKRMDQEDGEKSKGLSTVRAPSSSRPSKPGAGLHPKLVAD